MEKQERRNIASRALGLAFDKMTGYEAQDHAEAIARAADAAGVDARLLMAILLTESGARQRWPVSNLDVPLFILDEIGARPGASIGIGQMQRGAYEETLDRHRGEVLGDINNRKWGRLLTDDGLAIRAVAWRLRDLQDEINAKWISSSSKLPDRHALVAYGYNAGRDSMIRVASSGVEPRALGLDYVRRVVKNQRVSDQFYCDSQYWSCKS